MGGASNATDAGIGPAPGTPLPTAPLRDQAGREVTARAFAGRDIIVTFIYTHCPLPDFCPLMMSRLNEAASRLRKAGRRDDVQMVAISFDPARDTPEVLAAYGRAHITGEEGDPFRRWSLLTGTPDDVGDLGAILRAHLRARRQGDRARPPHGGRRSRGQGRRRAARQPVDDRRTDGAPPSKVGPALRARPSRFRTQSGRVGTTGPTDCPTLRPTKHAAPVSKSSRQHITGGIHARFARGCDRHLGLRDGRVRSCAAPRVFGHDDRTSAGRTRHACR